MSGEGRTADDVIVRDAWYLRHELGRNVFVVTNDQGLIGRVKRHRSPAGSVQVLHTRAFARLLGIEDKKLLAGHIALLYDDYTRAQELFLSSLLQAYAPNVRK